ncbi:hypothetical protein YPPY113_2966 [Yersinia pestis PY-113]|nr:hypothetical protein YPPY03_2879 [Yersinia pestis PY-03]EIS40833.1 hypothetical protein YPPY58_2899 [Yersinia pestis PY-58]EIT62385.1 hypothetical protein YPPY113_2966 [Yersinia pestis PY-113]
MPGAKTTTQKIVNFMLPICAFYMWAGPFIYKNSEAGHVPFSQRGMRKTHWRLYILAGTLP